MEFEKSFSRILKSLTRAAGMKQADLCRCTDIPTSLMSDYFQGKKIPALRNAKLIAAALGVTLDTLCGKDRVPQKEQAEGRDEGADEQMLLVRYRRLNSSGQSRLEEYLDMLEKNPVFSMPQGEDAEPTEL